MMTTLSRAARGLKSALNLDALNLIQASGAAAGQEVFHLHFHLVPRRPGDGAGLGWTPQPGDRSAIGQVQARVAAAME